MRIIYMGTPDFAVPALECLAQSRHEVTLVITQPDKAKGRGHGVSVSPVKACAEKYGLPVFQPERVRREEALQRIRDEKPDAIVVAAYGQILPKALLEIPPYGCFNIHGSLLPKLRGAAPIQQAVLDGEEKSGITIMQMDEGVDTGDILLQREVLLDPKETAGSLYDKLSVLGGPMLLQVLDEAEAGTLKPVKQDEAGSSYAKMLTKEMGRIDWTESAEAIERKIRGFYPWPCAYTTLRGKNCKIYAADVSGMDPKGYAPGTVVGTDKEHIYVAAGTGVLAVTELQLEGKKRMEASAFLLGTRLEEGEQL